MTFNNPFLVGEWTVHKSTFWKAIVSQEIIRVWVQSFSSTPEKKLWSCNQPYVKLIMSVNSTYHLQDLVSFYISILSFVTTECHPGVGARVIEMVRGKLNYFIAGSYLRIFSFTRLCHILSYEGCRAVEPYAMYSFYGVTWIVVDHLLI